MASDREDRGRERRGAVSPGAGADRRGTSPRWPNRITRKVARILDARGDDDSAALASARPRSRIPAAPRLPEWRPPGRGGGRGFCVSGRQTPSRRPSPAAGAPPSRGSTSTPTCASRPTTVTASSTSPAASEAAVADGRLTALADGMSPYGSSARFPTGPRRSCSPRSSSSSDSCRSSRAPANTSFASTASLPRPLARGRRSFQLQRPRCRRGKPPGRSRPRGTASRGPSFCAGSFSSTRSPAPVVTAACVSSPPSPSPTPPSGSSATWVKTPRHPPSPALALRQARIRRLSSASSAAQTPSRPHRTLPLDPLARRGRSCWRGISSGIRVLVFARQVGP